LQEAYSSLLIIYKATLVRIAYNVVRIWKYASSLHDGRGNSNGQLKKLNKRKVSARMRSAISP